MSAVSAAVVLDPDVSALNYYERYAVPLLSHEALYALMPAAKAGDKRAVEAIVLANIGLVRTAMKNRYFKQFHSVSQSDMLSYGIDGLLSAIRTFKLDLGWKFSTHATSHVFAAIQRNCRNEEHTIRLPVHISIAKRGAYLARRGGVPLTAKQEKAERLALLADSSLSLDVDLSGEQSNRDSVLDISVCTSEESPFPSPDLAFERRELSSGIDLLLDKILKPMEADVVRRRFGLGAFDLHTLDQVADVYDLTRERIRQIQKEAVGKLRLAMKRDNEAFCCG